MAVTPATSPFSQVKPVDGPAIRSLNSDGSHQISVSGQGVQGDEAAIRGKPQPRQAFISHTPSPGASRATHSRHFDLRDAFMTLAAAIICWRRLVR
ncbi:hypothetical protein GCM10023178_00240 [Actinomadura luteofluorescens]